MSLKKPYLIFISSLIIGVFFLSAYLFFEINQNRSNVFNVIKNTFMIPFLGIEVIVLVLANYYLSKEEVSRNKIYLITSILITSITTFLTFQIF